ncbi:MAG: hypothetical protein KDA54_01855 [Phycisphaerales bacterium]|nr:hypothetical protein [Phycisphaerales bacterium]
MTIWAGQRLRQNRALYALARSGLIAILATFFCVAGCTPSIGGGDGGGDGNGGGGSGGNTVDFLDGPRLLAAGGDNILTFRRDDTLTGNVAPAMNLVGSATELVDVKGIAVNSAGELIVLTAQPNASQPDIVINVYADARRLNGNQAPVRQVRDTGIAQLSVRSIAMDVNRDMLYILISPPGLGAPSIAMYEGTAGPGFDNERGPDRTITSPDLDRPTEMFVTVDDQLYVGGEREINVFTDVSTKEGEQDADHRIFGISGDFVFGLAIDGNDTLYSLGSAGFIDQVTEISTQQDAVTRAAQIEILDASFPGELVLDSAGTAYFVSSARILAYDDVSTLDGEQTPTREISGDMTELISTINGGADLLVLD